jgi:predicted ATP-grasp superfamily ATP-dependent carboligase
VWHRISDGIVSRAPATGPQAAATAVGAETGPMADDKPIKTASARARSALILAQGDWRLEYRVLRCAAECFDRVYVLGAGASAMLRLSRFCSGFFRLKGSFSDADQAATVVEINRLCDALGIDRILPAGPGTTRFLTGHGPLLVAPHYPVPPREVFDILNDKWRFAGLCASLGVPHPPTRYFATRAEFAELAERDRAAYPLVMKPLRMAGGRGVTKLNNLTDFSRSTKYEPLIVQDYVPGDDYCCFFFCRNGTITASITYLKTTAGVVFVDVPEITQTAVKFIEHFHYNGVIGFDILRSHTGEIAFIECNPRFWIRIELPMIFGLNFIDVDLLSVSDPIGINNEIPMLSPRHLAKALFTPWRLSRNDLALIKYLSSDPLPNAMQRIANAFSPRHSLRRGGSLEAV